jgi:uncharacterized protein
MYDVAVVGAGPGGLAAALAGRGLGASVVILEQGKPLAERERDDQTDLVCGVGGAGLCSDGKFSFFPAATALWLVQPAPLLRAGYEWLKEILRPAGLKVPDFPRNATGAGATVPAGGLRRKDYPSFYLPVAERNSIVRMLAAELASCIRPGVRVTSIEQRAGDCAVLRGSGGSVLTRARRVVLAPGRLGPLGLRRSLPAGDMVFRRVELGVRVEQPAERFVLSGDRCLDPKFMIGTSAGWSCRTFCCCRQGMVVAANFSGLTSVSGRADCPPSGRSNIGFLVRFTDLRTGMAAWRESLCHQPLSEPVVEDLNDVIDPAGHIRPESHIARILGFPVARRLAEGLGQLSTSIGMQILDAQLHAPAIEGVGWYPRIGSNLQIPRRPVFVAGDATGIFRGLTAALVSGYVAGSAAAAVTTAA